MQWLRLKGCHVACDECASGEICSHQHMWVAGSVIRAVASGASLKFGVQGASVTNWFSRDNEIRLYDASKQWLIIFKHSSSLTPLFGDPIFITCWLPQFSKCAKLASKYSVLHWKSSKLRTNYGVIWNKYSTYDMNMVLPTVFPKSCQHVCFVRRRICQNY